MSEKIVDKVSGKRRKELQNKSCCKVSGLLHGQAAKNYFLSLTAKINQFFASNCFCNIKCCYDFRAIFDE